MMNYFVLVQFVEVIGDFIPLVLASREHKGQKVSDFNARLSGFVVSILSDFFFHIQNRDESLVNNVLSASKNMNFRF